MEHACVSMSISWEGFWDLEAAIQKFKTLNAVELNVQDLEWLTVSEPGDEDSNTAVEWI